MPCTHSRASRLALTTVTDRSRAPLPRRWAVIAGTSITFAAAWVFRWLTVDFTNDHFVHLSRARQMLLGELPVRDFFDPGLPLHYAASAAAMAIAGQTLVGEAVLTVSLVALGAALTFWLAARTSRSIVIAMIATLVAVVIFPRLYNYPKIFLYPLALLAFWRYAMRSTTLALASIAVLVVVSFLFRLDHAVYIGIASVAAIVLAHRQALRPLAAELLRFAVMTGALLLPYFVYVEATAGIHRYFGDTLSQSENVATARILAIPFVVDWSQPWFVVDPPSRPRVSIRWRDGTDADERTERERRYGLTDGADDGSYVLADDSRENILALLNDPLVADTHRIDKESLRPIRWESWIQRARDSTPLLRVRVAPGIFTPTNALAWLYYVTVLVPVAALAALVIAWRRGTLDAADVAVIGAASVMCLVIDQGLLRGSPDSRLPDVVGPTMVLAAWVTGIMFHRGAARPATTDATSRSSRAWTILAGRAAVVVVWSGTLWAAATFGELGERVDASRVLAGPGGVRDRMREVTQAVQSRPIDWYAPVGSTGIRGLTRYVLECTRPSDRLLTGAFEPQIFFYAERGFAGGQVYLRGGWHSSPEDQALTIERMRREHVPLVIFSASTLEEIQRYFPLVYSYVQQQYQEAARSGFGEEREYVVLFRRGLQPSTTTAALQLPCYR